MATRRRRLTDRVVGSNTRDVIFSLTIEALDDLLGGSDVTQQRLEALEFSSDKFNLVSLDGIEFIGVADVSLRQDIHTLSIQNNQLTTLVELVQPLTKQPLFENLAHIFAPNNYIQFLCSSPKDILNNGWPALMENLVELDLSGNFLDCIPDCTFMPRIRRLRLAHNQIRPPWKQLKLARELEELDLSSNSLDWTEAEFMLEVKVLRELRVLRNLKIANNPFCLILPNYVLFCLKELVSAQQEFLGADSKIQYFIEYIDDIECNETMSERAIALQQPSAKRNIFLSKVGRSSNNALIDPRQEHEYLASIAKEGEDEEEGGAAGVEGGVRETKSTAAEGGGEEEGVRSTGDASKVDTETSLYKLMMLAELCLDKPRAATPAISMLLKYCKKLRDRDLSSNGPSYLFDDLIPPTEQVSEQRRYPYQELAANKFTQSIFVLTQRLPHMLTSLTCVR